MIINKEGDLFRALSSGEIDRAVHCCNSHGKMNSGVAKQVREQYPNTFKAYIKSLKDFESSVRDPMGSISWNLGDGILNIIGQRNYGYDGKRYGHYGHIAAGLNSAMQMKVLTADTRVGFPYKFACDRAGCNWDIILELIEGLIVPVVKDVYIYKLVNSRQKSSASNRHMDNWIEIPPRYQPREVFS